MQRCTELINDLLSKYCVINFGTSPSECPLYFEFNYESEENYLNNADIVSTLITAGVPLKENEVYKKTGFSVPDANEKTIQNIGV